METRQRPVTQTSSKTPSIPRLRCPISENCELQPTRSRSRHAMTAAYATQFWLSRTNVWRRVTSPARGAKRLRSYDARDLYQGSATRQSTSANRIRTPGRSRRFSRPHCPRCKKDAEINCVCCDHCRRECALDAKGSQLKRL